MDKLREIYQEVIVDHTRTPHNFGEMQEPTHQAQGHNPLCGDQIKLFLKMNENDIIEDVLFTGTGCSIATASASLMTDALKGKTRVEALRLFQNFHQMMMREEKTDEVEASLGKLRVLSGVCDYPARVKCATLAWHTLQAALQNEMLPVSTE